MDKVLPMNRAKREALLDAIQAYGTAKQAGGQDFTPENEAACWESFTAILELIDNLGTHEEE